MGIWSRWRSRSSPDDQTPDKIQLAASAVEVGETTTQVSRASDSLITPFFVPRNRLQKLELFAKAHSEVALINQGIEALVLLCNGNLVGDSGDSEVDREVLTHLERLNFHDVNARSLRQYFAFGFSGEETVWTKDFREIVKIAVIDSRTMFVRKNAQGDIEEYLQVPPIPLLRSAANRSSIPFAIRVPSDRMTWNCRNPLGDNPYGTSIIQPLLSSGLPRTLQTIEQSKGIIYNKLAANPMHHNFNPPPTARFQKAEAEKNVKEFKKVTATRKLDQDIYSAGPWSSSPLFQYSGIDFSKDQQFVLEQIMSGMQLVPELFGYSFGQAQSQTKEKLAIMLDRIERVRKEREHQINTVLMPQLESTYLLPITPKVRFEHPRIIDAKLEAEKFSIWIQYVQQLLRMGFIDGDKAARMLELAGVYDEQKLQEWLDSSQAEAPAPTNEQRIANQISEEEGVIE